MTDGPGNIRCIKCRKLVARGQFIWIEFKCARCGEVNIFPKKADKPVDMSTGSRIDFTA